MQVAMALGSSTHIDLNLDVGMKCRERGKNMYRYI